MIGDNAMDYAANKMQAPAATKVTELKITKADTPAKKAGKAMPKKATKKGASATAKKAGARKPVKQAKTAAASATASASQQAPKASSVTEPFAQGNDLLKAVMESGSIYSQIAKNVADEVAKFGNKNLSDNMEMSRDFFGCRTLSDMFEIQNRILQKNVDNFFRQSGKLSEVMFRAASQSGAPLNTSFISASDSWKRSFNSRASD